MKLKLISAVAAAVGLSFAMPVFAAEKAASPCAGLTGDAASKCRKEQRDADVKAGKSGAPKGTSEVAGGDAKGTTGADKRKNPSGAKGETAPKGTSEVAGGDSKAGVRKAEKTGDPSGAKGGTAPKGASETAGDKK